MSNIEMVEGAAVPTGTHESNVLFNRAVELVSRNRAGAARKQLEMALQICPQHAAYLSLYGLCVAAESEDYESARRICERAVRMNPRDPLGRVNLGKVLRMEGDNEGAYEEFLTAWKMDRTHPAPAAELSRMGIRRPPLLRFLPRSHWANIHLGRLRSRVLRLSARIGS
jgi:tetratricopeptide (TPR) repeat protein